MSRMKAASACAECGDIPPCACSTTPSEDTEVMAYKCRRHLDDAIKLSVLAHSELEKALRLASETRDRVLADKIVDAMTAVWGSVEAVARHDHDAKRKAVRA